MKKEYGLYGTALLAGVLVWIVVAAFSGRREAWDSELYFTFGIPALCLVAGILGFVEPARSWRWGMVPLLGQAVWLFTTQGFGNLWPLGLVTFGIFAVPSIVTARVGAAVATRIR